MPRRRAAAGLEKPRRHLPDPKLRSFREVEQPARKSASSTHAPLSMGCFARNSTLRAALDPATDDLLFDIVINRRGARAHRRPPAAHPLRAPTPSSFAAAGARLGGLRFDVTDGVTVAKR